MAGRRAILASLAIAVAGVAWFFWPHPGNGDGASSANSAPALAGRPGAGPRSPAASPPLETSDLARDLNSPAHDIRADLRIVLEVLDAFRTNFPSDGNPVGLNAEITAALSGRNRLRLALIPPGHAAISAAGELCDRWGTPFFFHAESAAKMEIRSAGPDRKLWTGDDAVLAP